jgi:DNA-binding MarR family transcriptional regulator
MEKPNSIETITSFKAPEESPGYLLWHVSLAWRTSIETILKPLDLTHPQFVVLAVTAWLTRKGDHINQLDVSKASGLDPNTTSQVLRTLEAKNFIERKRTLNERSKNPSLTTKGSKVIAKALPAVEQADAQFFKNLSSQEMVNLVSLFQKLQHE